jgi:hypothetical protein
MRQFEEIANIIEDKGYSPPQHYNRNHKTIQHENAVPVIFAKPATE